MSVDMMLYHEFRRKWPLGSVREMKLDEYTKAKKNVDGDLDTFTYWLEIKLQDYGSMGGGSSFKFGIYSRNDEEVKESKSGRMYTKDYAWYTKYGETKEEAFLKVRGLVVAVVEAAQRGDLDSIDAIDLGDVYKWKIAFHFQKDVEQPTILDIFDPVALCYLAGLPKNTKISECQRKLLSTIGRSKVTDFTDALWARYQKSLVPEIVDSVDNRQENLNTIYYGPPGTGKTYLVLQLLKQIDKESEVPYPKQKPKILRADAVFWHLAPGSGGHLWPKLKTGNRLGYEWCDNEYGDLKTVRIDNEHSSIIKRFASVKKGDYLVVISGYKLLGLAEAKDDYDYAKAKTDEYNFQTIEVDWIEQFDIPILLNSTQTMTFCRLNWGSRWDAFVNGLLQHGIVIGAGDDIESGSIESATTGRNHMLVTFHQSYSYEDFIQGIKPVMDEDEDEGSDQSLRYCIAPGVFYRACDLACQKAGFIDLEAAIQVSKAERAKRFIRAKPFYLVIDEINRGNIANILGELITLIETDKRLGAENEIIVDLPYSKKPFGVPSNLYIVGTMNTADRNVEALDSALRRRFSFKATYPKPEVIEQPKGLAIDLCKLLAAINARIVQTLDRNHMIGHAYFTTIKDAADPLEALVDVFQNKVIPQLEEYFFNAPERIYQILGDAFVLKQKAEYPLFGQRDDKLEDVWAIQFPLTDTDENRALAEKAFIGLYASHVD